MIQLCISGNGHPGKWLNSKSFNYVISDFLSDGRTYESGTAPGALIEKPWPFLTGVTTKGETVGDILPISRRGACRKSTRISASTLLPFSGVI